MADDDYSEGFLECNVDKPQKENDGTKDAYISYLVSTKVHLSLDSLPLRAIWQLPLTGRVAAQEC